MAAISRSCHFFFLITLFVGDGNTDHYCWQRPEDMTTSRQAYRIDPSNPGSDLAGETAAAMAAASMVFRRYNPSYAKTLLSHAYQLFDFADKYRGKYDSSITVAQKYYRSVSGYASFISLGDLVRKLAKYDLLDWVGRAKLVDCICSFILLKPQIGQLVRKLQVQDEDVAGEEIPATPKNIFQLVNQFQSAAFNSFSRSSVLGRLNSPSGLGMRSPSSSRAAQFGHAQNSNSSINGTTTV